MKKVFIGLAALLFGLVGTANGQITNSAHDFSTMGWSGGEICKPCHTPHNAAPNLPRLWNHEITTATYIMHGGTGTAANDLDTISRLCMSCHDGTVALDSFGGTSGTNFMPGRYNLGTDLTNDHPIGSDAEYPPEPQPSWWASAFRPANSNHQVSNGWGNLNLKSWVNSGGVTMYVVGCTTCHNPHNRGNYGHMLNFSNSASRVCLTCHIK